MGLWGIIRGKDCSDVVFFYFYEKFGANVYLEMSNLIQSI